MSCTCADQCAQSKHCIAIGFPDDGSCWVLCSEDRGVAADDIPTLQLDTQIDVDTHGVELLAFAEFLAQRSAVELLVPASAARGKVGLTVKSTSFESVLEQAGLVAGGPVKGRA